MATHSTILAWRITWTEEPGRLQSMGLQRDRIERLTHTLYEEVPFGVLARNGWGGAAVVGRGRDGT